jgi:hypothetical protein
MRTYILYSFILMLMMIPTQADESVPEMKVDVLSNPVVARSLADACDIVRLVNEFDWKAVKKRSGEKNHLTLIVEPQSKVKDWHGIGAYRGSEIDEAKKSVKHRFSYGVGRLSVHEVWITYSYTEDGFGKPSFLFLGW